MEYSAIHVRNLSKSFRKRRGLLRGSRIHALENVSFEVKEGETYGLLGPNGSGKSSLIRILSTLLLADSGEVSLMGHSLPQEQEEVRRIIGRVSVDAAFYKKLSARENLLYTALLYGRKPAEAEKRAMKVLDRLGLENTTFSTPLEEILEELRSVQGTTILLTTHDMTEAERLCGRIGFLAHGKLVAEGTADDLRRRAKARTLDDAFIHLTGEGLSQNEKTSEEVEVFEEV